jgi:hypothetical protein
MNRNLIAAAIAAVIVPAAAFDAAAAPAGVTTFGKSYALQCDANGFDGTALKARLMVKNTSGRIIKQGTPITLRFAYGFGPGPRPARVPSQTQTAYRDISVNDSIGFDKPAGVRRCTASATLRPDLQTKIKATR